MKKTISSILLALALLVLPTNARAAELLIPGGQIIGLVLENDQVTVAAFDPETGTAARDAGLKTGDRITRIDQTPITCAEDVRQALAKSDGQVDVFIMRQSKPFHLQIQPRITCDGPRLGVYLKQGVTGVGTLTWYDPDSGTFGALGHGVNDSSGQLLTMKDGRICEAGVVSVKKGAAGDPGQLMGMLDGDNPLGNLKKNTQQGVFGKTSQPITSEPLPIATAEQVRTGPATIRSTIHGKTMQEYSVQIIKIYPTGRSGGRNMLLKVTDPALLESTGGIVQGMSGSPIIQDGKLIGAVTHVLVNDPTTGYGIFIENMLDAAA